MKKIMKYGLGLGRGWISIKVWRRRIAMRYGGRGRCGRGRRGSGEGQASRHWANGRRRKMEGMPAVYMRGAGHSF